MTAGYGRGLSFGIIILSIVGGQGRMQKIAKGSSSRNARLEVTPLARRACTRSQSRVFCHHHGLEAYTIKNEIEKLRSLYEKQSEGTA